MWLVLGSSTVAFAQSVGLSGGSLPPQAIDRQAEREALKAAGLLQARHDAQQAQREANQHAALPVGQAGINGEQALIGARILRDRLSRTPEGGLDGFQKR